MRHMSFSATTRQMEAELKTETRRLGWKTLKRGDLLLAIEQGQGLKKGQKVRPLYPIEVLDVRFEPLNAIDAEGVQREGLRWMTRAEFVAFFCSINGCAPDTEVTVIRFRRVNQ